MQHATCEAEHAGPVRNRGWASLSIGGLESGKFCHGPAGSIAAGNGGMALQSGQAPRAAIDLSRCIGGLFMRCRPNTLSRS